MNNRFLLISLTGALSLSAVALAAAYTSVDVTLTQSAGELTVAASTRVTPTLGVTKPVVRGGVAYVTARHGVGEWAVGLSPKLPISLNVSHDTGSATLNLAGLNVPKLNVKHGSGETNIQFGSATTATITKNVGSLSIYTPANTGVKLLVKRLGTGSITVDGVEVSSGTNMMGEYKTANYATAARKVSVTVTQESGSIEVFKAGTTLPR